MKVVQAEEVPNEALLAPVIHLGVELVDGFKTVFGEHDAILMAATQALFNQDGHMLDLIRRNVLNDELVTLMESRVRTAYFRRSMAPLVLIEGGTSQDRHPSVPTTR